MAKNKGGIFAPFIGKLGPVIGGIWKGIPFLRTAPVPTGKKKKRSVKQLENEEKFKFVNLWMIPFHPYLTIGFANEAVGRTEISAAFSKNFGAAVIGVYPNLGIDYSKVVISMGKLSGLEDPVAVMISADTLKLTWSKNSEVNVSFDDQVMLVVYCPEIEKADGFVGGVKRTTKECVFAIHPKMIGKALEVYVGVTSLNRKKIANSQYLGKIMPLSL